MWIRVLDEMIRYFLNSTWQMRTKSVVKQYSKYSKTIYKRNIAIRAFLTCPVI